MGDSKIFRHYLIIEIQLIVLHGALIMENALYFSNTFAVVLSSVLINKITLILCGSFTFQSVFL